MTHCSETYKLSDLPRMIGFGIIAAITIIMLLIIKKGN